MHIQIILLDRFDPLDAIAPYEVPYADGSASDGAGSVELVAAEGSRETAGGTGGPALHSAGALGPVCADILVVPGAFGRAAESSEVLEEEAHVGERKQDEFIPVLAGRVSAASPPAPLTQAMDENSAMSFDGIWNSTIPTPTGKTKPVVQLRAREGSLTGAASGAGEDVLLTDIPLGGDRLTWKQAMAKSMWLNSASDVTVDGDTPRGTARADLLPSSPVTGERRAVPELQA